MHRKHIVVVYTLDSVGIPIQLPVSLTVQIVREHIYNLTHSTVKPGIRIIRIQIHVDAIAD
jgi:hypothetical protein